MNASLSLRIEDMVLTGDKTLDDDIIDATPEEVHVDVDLLEVLAEGGEGPLETVVVVLQVVIMHVVLTLFVDAVVGQVHKLVCFRVLRLVLFGSKASKSLLENIDSKWLDTGDKHINAQVKLVTVDQQGVSDVAGHN